MPAAPVCSKVYKAAYPGSSRMQPKVTRVTNIWEENLLKPFGLERVNATGGGWGGQEGINPTHKKIKLRGR